MSPELVIGLIVYSIGYIYCWRRVFYELCDGNDIWDGFSVSGYAIGAFLASSCWPVALPIAALCSRSNNWNDFYKMLGTPSWSERQREKNARNKKKIAALEKRNKELERDLSVG